MQVADILKEINETARAVKAVDVEVAAVDEEIAVLDKIKGNLLFKKANTNRAQYERVERLCVAGIDGVHVLTYKSTAGWQTCYFVKKTTIDALYDDMCRTFSEVVASLIGLQTKTHRSFAFVYPQSVPELDVDPEHIRSAMEPDHDATVRVGVENACRAAQEVLKRDPHVLRILGLVQDVLIFTSKVDCDRAKEHIEDEIVKVVGRRGLDHFTFLVSKFTENHCFCAALTWPSTFDRDIHPLCAKIVRRVSALFVKPLPDRSRDRE